ncbi:MAG: hypothetical protein ACD_49C00067G0054 [uncultured bacterium (gcode 4)]|uniref:Dihydroorotase n=1 Tax=uncultured bacterium (gcode 4) TaxID=1234023 RepID=K2BBD8_9BACT|nr:MAG: hypothetical protein ACD_49C00067G0054 [uncultured bacterium (gcode 4)]
MENLEFKCFTETTSLAEHLEMMKIHWDCADLVQSCTKQISEIVLESPFDTHLHLRDWEMLKAVAPSSATTFAGWIIMPNLAPAIETLEQVISYKWRIMEAIDWENFTPYMTINFRSDYTREFLKKIKPHIIWIKMYPKWQTTNSEGWVDWANIEEYRNTLTYMQELWIPLLVHWERIDGWYKIDELDKERKFAPIYEKLAQEFPKLKIIMEHVSTKECIELIDKYPNLYATVTLHHLLLIHNDIVSMWIQPHHFFKPIAKLWEDRKAILKYVLSGNPKIMLGTDSAPHEVGKKECACWCAWAFTAPIALQALIQIFESFWQLDNLHKFASENAKKNYEIDLPQKNVKFIKKDFEVSDKKELPYDYFINPNVRKELITPAKLFLWWKKLAWDLKGKNLPWTI